MRVLVFAVIVAGGVPAQSWRNVSAAPPTGLTAMAHDGARQRTVLVRKPPGAVSGPCETWEWNGVRWARRATAVAPVAREGHAMAWDEARGRVVLFGGASERSPAATVFGDTWEWDGSAWAQAQPSVMPAPRVRHALVYDRIRKRCVLFGGAQQFSYGSYYADTWEWDGTSWTQSVPAITPPRRCGHAAAFDAVRGRTVIFGGATFGPISNYMNDTWEWDGSAWSQRMPALAPPARFESAMCFDPARATCVLFGGGSPASMSDTWDWDGTSWTQRVTNGSPPARSGHALVLDTGLGLPLVQGGIDSDWSTWALAGSLWINVGATSPTPRITAWTWDLANRALLLFGGWRTSYVVTDGTWLYDGSAWRDASSGLQPSPRAAFGLASDASHRQVVLFGGRTATADSAETWLWDGVAWTKASPPVSPPARMEPALGYDPLRQRVVLFGGRPGTSSSNYLDDTWEWDGSSWQQATPVASPPKRSFAALAWDPNTKKMLLCGGSASILGPTFADTWTWDGTSWSQLPALLPEPRYAHRLATDFARGRVVCAGGTAGPPVAAPVPATYEWDGTAWTATATLKYETAAFAYDHARGVCVRYGDGEVWEYATASPPACLGFGQGCPGSAGTPALDARFMSHAVVGTTFWLDCERLRVAGPAFLALGAARLALDLGPAGMPGCWLHAGGELVLGGTTGASGVAPFPLALPGDPALLGQAFVAQTFAPDAAANPLGVSASNAVEVRLGR